ncbi:MAG: hypothetical protein ABL955_09375, partial [Elusimicrobiota bacterium]
MKTMKPRPSTILSRALLAAFLATLPGSRDAFAQTMSKVGAVGTGAGAIGSVGTTLGGITATPGLSATLMPASLSLAPLAAPAALTPTLIVVPAALVPVAPAAA